VSDVVLDDVKLYVEMAQSADTAAINKCFYAPITICLMLLSVFCAFPRETAGRCLDISFCYRLCHYECVQTLWTEKTTKCFWYAVYKTWPIM